MRASLVAAFLFFAALPLASVSARHPHSSKCGCGAAVPAPVAHSSCSACSACSPCQATPVVDPCSTCGVSTGCGTACGTGLSCGGCGGGCGCGGGLCSNPAAFYEALYAEFYARNPWYLEAKAREAAERRARLYPQPDPAVAPAPAKAVKPVSRIAG